MASWIILLLLFFLSVNASDFYLPAYLDPCHAAGYSDDAALSDREALQMKHRQESKTEKTKKRQRRGAVFGVLRLWDHAVIPYEIDPSYNEFQNALFMNAFRAWEANTCLSFVPKEDSHSNWIVITKGDCGCSSFVGNMRLGGQGLSIGRGCDKFGVLLHELGHAVGYWHEQSRPDRDNYVQINLDNVADGHAHNFDKYGGDLVDSRGEPYDFKSIMHYSSQQYSKGRMFKTIIPRPDEKIFIGQRVSLSSGDVRQTNKMYRCPKCGRTLQGTTGKFWTPRTSNRSICQWRITVSPGERVVFNVTSMVLNCSLGYIEIRDGYWYKSPLLGRYCGSRTPPQLTTVSNRMWIEFVGIGKVDMNYEALCGGESTSETGIVMSPNYPDYYQSDKACKWRISVDKPWKLLLRFDVFETEQSENCEFDYLEIKDGCQPDSAVLGRFCGDEVPSDIISTGHEVCMTFGSDDSVHAQGFLIHYNKIV